MIKTTLPFDELISKAWIEIPGFLSPSYSSALLERASSLDELGGLRPAGIGDSAEVVSSIRRDEIRWVEDWSAKGMPETREMLLSMGRELRMELRAPLKSFEAHFSRYGEGAFYKKHIDQHLGQKRRLVTFVLYLNSSQGGELAIYDPKDRNKLQALVRPEAGKLVLFLSGEIFHEVRPSRSERFGLTGWFRDDLDPSGKCNI